MVSLFLFLLRKTIDYVFYKFTALAPFFTSVRISVICADAERRAVVLSPVSGF